MAPTGTMFVFPCCEGDSVLGVCEGSILRVPLSPPKGAGIEGFDEAGTVGEADAGAVDWGAEMGTFGVLGIGKLPPAETTLEKEIGDDWALPSCEEIGVGSWPGVFAVGAPSATMSS